MHESMVRLYKIALDKGIRGQSAVARELNESPQTVKNWESRGISVTGALKAQGLFGCDANWILGYPLTAGYRTDVSSALHVEERPRNPWGWPFKEVDYSQFTLLSDDERRLVEETILMFVKRHEPNQLTPEKKTGIR